MLVDASLLETDVERLRRLITPDDIRAVYSIIQRCLRTGRRERKSLAKTISARNNAEIARATKKGDTALVRALRAKYYPHLVAAEDARAAAGLPPLPKKSRKK